MSKRFSGIICGFLIAMLATSAVCFASQKTDTLKILYRDIKLSINGEIITPRDAAGNIVEPFASNGTTYLPVRAVGEALGRTVDWDNETSTVIIGGKPLKVVNLTSQIPLSMNRTRFEINKSGDYTAIVLEPYAISVDTNGWYDFSEKIEYDLKGKAVKLTGTLMKPIVSDLGSAKIQLIFRNEKNEVIFKTDTIRNKDRARDFEVDVTDCERLVIEFSGASTIPTNTKAASLGIPTFPSATIRVSNLLLHTTDY